MAFWLQSATTFPGWLADTAHDLSQDNGEGIIRAALIVCGLIVALVALGPDRLRTWRDAVQPTPLAQAAPSPAPHVDPLARALEAELVKTIDDWKAQMPTLVTAPTFGPFDVLRKKTTEFIESVFGAAERQRLGVARPDRPAETLTHNIEDFIRTLEDLRDHPERWDLKVNEDGLRDAINRRRARTTQESIVEAATPTPPDPAEPAAPKEFTDDQALREDLIHLRAKGRKLRDSLQPGLSGALVITTSARSPEGAVDDWVTEVVDRLVEPGEHELVGRFKLAGAVSALFAGTSGLPAAYDPDPHKALRERLKRRLARLDEIIRELHP